MIDLGVVGEIVDRSRPRLGAGARVAPDPSTGGTVLLGPESIRPLLGTAAEVLALCDGRRSVAEVAGSIAARYGADPVAVVADVLEFLRALAVDGPGPGSARPGLSGVLAELTHRCPLRCAYCSNPVDPPTARGELDVDEWSRVLAEAAAIGALQAHLSGGEPLLRPDLPDLIASARSAGLYTNLITSGLGLTRAVAGRLRGAGLDHVQLSLQADEPALADGIAGVPAHRRKLEAARAVADAGLAMTINVVLHRANLDRLAAIIDRAASLGPARIELAHAQYYGWAWRNRAELVPAREQVDGARAVVDEAAGSLRGRIELVHVAPDYFGDRPKPCMNGWGRRQLTVDPVGDVLPCPTARSIPSLCFENVRDRPLASIWRDSAAFDRFRGTAWMPEPCRSCDRREVDFGGCRCQASLLTGDASSTDPACSLSPHREALARLVDPARHPDAVDGAGPIPRRNPGTASPPGTADPSTRRSHQP